jgi:hypothetical protein
MGTMVDENARFIRGNREASNFVGADAGEAQRFVGSQQAGQGEEIRSAVDELQVETAPDANRTPGPALPPRMRLNAPRLKVGFDFTPQADADVSARLTQRLETKLRSNESRRIEVSVVGDEAILRGEVASDRDRKLAELLAGFEPGIARVRNQLVVRPADSPQKPREPPAP